MMMLVRAVREELYPEIANKETETVGTADSSDSDDEESDCECSEGSLEDIDLLVLGDDDEDYYPSFYYDDDVDLLGTPHKNTCIQRALSGFTGMLQALMISPPQSTAADAPMDIVMTDSFLMTECFTR